jgi:hypothetical protein
LWVALQVDRDDRGSQIGCGLSSSAARLYFTPVWMMAICTSIC